MKAGHVMTYAEHAHLERGATVRELAIFSAGIACRLVILKLDAFSVPPTPYAIRPFVVSSGYDTSR